MERCRREADGQAAAGGAPLIHQLHEEEVMRFSFDEGEMKRRRWHITSLAQRVALVLDAVAASRISFGGGGIRLMVGDKEGTDWAERGRMT
jgi:hypothetical protein